MTDFYADYPFPEVVLKIDGTADFCVVGNVVAGMKSGEGRVEEIVDGGIRVHPLCADAFCDGDTIVSPIGAAKISGVFCA